MTSLERLNVKLTTAIVAGIAILTFVAADVRWKSTVSRDLHEIRLSQQQYGWHRNDMARWVRDTERVNLLTDWRGADVNQD